MNVQTKLRSIVAFSLGLYMCVAFAHDVPVHEAITANAAIAAMAHSPAYAGFVDMISSDLIYTGFSGATNAMALGSDLEDNSVPPKDEGGLRSLNHFYDPLDNTYGKGLSDSLGFTPLGLSGDKRESVGTNSFAWGSISNCIGINFPGERFLTWHLGANINTSNIWSWQDARYYEWRGLTATNQLDRQTNLDNMFRSVGQVMHLLEDTSQPQHVRNEITIKG